MHLTNIMSAMDSKTIKTELQPATRNQNWRLLPQVSNQTLSPPEGILETKVQNPQEMCRTEMTRLIVSRDRFDPGVGTWVWMTPSPYDLSRRVFDEIVKASKCIRLEARNRSLVEQS